ncbi:MAG: hypothetical protein WC998_03400 [Candidatus Paceibacterota bacterium]|jgi:hypothetical protein
MSNYSNLGQALLIIAAVYFYFTFNLNEWVVFGMIALAVLSWVYPGFSKERKKYIEAQIELLKVKTEYYRRKLQ